MRKFLNNLSLKRLASFNKLLLFKHSRTCPVSLRAYREVVNFMESDPSEIPVVLVDVLDERAYSMQLANHLELKHESPQVIYLENGKMRWNDSHFKVSSTNLEAATSSVT